MRGLAVTEIQNRHAPGPCARTETDVVYMIKMAVKEIKGRQTTCQDKEQGPTRRNRRKKGLTETG